MNLTALLADIYRRVNATSAPPTDVVTRLTSFLNTTHRQLLGMPGMEDLRDGGITFVSVNGQTNYGLPPAITRIEAITDRTTMLRLSLVRLDDVRTSDPGLVASGTPDSYAIRGYQQVALQPSVAAELFVKSTAAGDIQAATIEGIRTGGYFKTLTVNLTGVTAVSFGAAFTDFIEVTKFYVATAAVGTITLNQTSGAGTELARIPIGQTFPRYLGLQLYPTPSGAITYFVDYVRTVPEMVNGADEPLLPDDFHWLLVEGTLLKEWTKRDDDRRLAAEQAFRQGVSALKYFVNCTADFLPVVGREPVPRHSRLGPYYGGGF